MTIPTLLTLLGFVLAASSPAVAEERTKTWVVDRALWEARLAEGEVLSLREIGEGVTEPKRIELRWEDVEFSAVYKPIRRGRHHGFWESYEGEVAAYRLDVLIGLDMVPPTVVRRIGDELGSLQLWVENCATYKSLEGSVPRTPEFSRQISRMKMFDNLISNADRNAGNFLLDQDWRIVLIDHSRAFIERKSLFEGSKLPVQYDRRLVARLESLEPRELEDALANLLKRGQLEAILKRRDRILEHLAKLIAERGERAVLFEP